MATSNDKISRVSFNNVRAIFAVRYLDLKDVFIEIFYPYPWGKMGDNEIIESTLVIFSKDPGIRSEIVEPYKFIRCQYNRLRHSSYKQHKLHRSELINSVIYLSDLYTIFKEIEKSEQINLNSLILEIKHFYKELTEFLLMYNLIDIEFLKKLNLHENIDDVPKGLTIKEYKKMGLFAELKTKNITVLTGKYQGIQFSLVKSNGNNVRAKVIGKDDEYHYINVKEEITWE